MSSDCIFCKILAKDVPNYTVYENQSVLAFLDIFPCAKGHTVVIPKNHSVDVLEASAETMADLMVGVQETVKRLQTVLNPEGFTIGWNHGEAAGQSVPHLHVHIIPRWSGDGGGSMHSVVKKGEHTAVSEVAALFR